MPEPTSFGDWDGFTDYCGMIYSTPPGQTPVDPPPCNPGGRA